MQTSRLQWRHVQPDAAAVEGLRSALQLPRPVAELLVNRGVTTPAEAKGFLAPRLSNLSDPFLIAGMEVAVGRVIAALDGHETITVFGDYDVDGLSATALLVSVLRQLGANVMPFTPCRRRDGYGLTPTAFSRCVQEQAPSLVITVDCGTNSHDTLEAASRAGIDVIVTDHHEVAGSPAAALVVLNPKLGAPEAAQYLCGVGMAFKLAHAILKRLMAAGREADTNDLDLRDQLGLVALGTVCDIVPLVGENRSMVRYGLRRLESTTAPGIAALRAVAGISSGLSSYHLGFMLGPRLNAAGRLGHAAPALDLLLSDDAEQARELAQQLDEANRNRKRIEQEILNEALKETEAGFDEQHTFGIVVGRPSWDVGVVGIVASRLVRRYGRPSVVIAFDEQGAGKGSCRSVDGVDLVDVLDSCSSLLDTYGGHKAAAGVGLQQHNLDAFRDRFNAGCAAKLKGCDLRPVQHVDAWLDHLGEADRQLMNGIDQLRPFGCGNRTPVWGVRHVTILGQPRRVGADGAHLKLVVAGGGSQVDAIGFGMGDIEIPDGPVDVLFELDENNFRGHVSLQLKLQDLRPSVSPSPS